MLVPSTPSILDATELVLALGVENPKDVPILQFPPASPAYTVDYSEEEDSDGAKGYRFEFDEFGEPIQLKKPKKVMKKKRYPASFKKRALKYYHTHGRQAATEKFGLGPTTLYLWAEREAKGEFENVLTDDDDERRVGKRIPEHVYTEDFKHKVVQWYKLKGAASTVGKFGVQASLIYKWNRTVKPTMVGLDVSDQVRTHHRYDDSFKRKAVRSFKKFGLQKTLESFPVPPSNVYSWQSLHSLGRLGDDSDVESHVVPTPISPIVRKGKEQVNPRYTTGYKLKVLNYFKLHGLKATSAKFNVSIPSIRGWRARQEAGDFDGMEADELSDEEVPNLEPSPIASPVKPKPFKNLSKGSVKIQTHLDALLLKAREQIKAIEK